MRASPLKLAGINPKYAAIIRQRSRSEMSRSSSARTEGVPPSKALATAQVYPLIESCVHVQYISTSSAKATIDRPTLKCSDCGVKEDLWLCLYCGNIGCGRYSASGHALMHGSNQKHPVCMDLQSLACHCYDCDIFVAQDNLQSTVKEIRDYARDRLLSKQADSPSLKRPVSQVSPARGEKKKRQRVDQVVDPGQTGLNQMGNTCFMNSVIQSLSNTPQFRQYFLSTELLPAASVQKAAAKVPHVVSASPGPTTCKPQAGATHTANTSSSQPFFESSTESSEEFSDEYSGIALSLEMKNLFTRLWAGDDLSVTPESLFKCVWKFLPHFYGFQQHDAQEFLRFLLDRLHGELSTLSTSPGRSKSIVHDTFQGSLLSELKCLRCGKIRRKLDPFLDLSISIPQKYVPKFRNDNPSCTLEDCLDKFTGPETMEATEKYSCKSCLSNESAIKQFTFDTVPNVLCIHVKRFRWPNRGKISTHVEPPEVLDLSQFTKRQSPMPYRLFAVISHHGYGTWAGHYTSFCLSPAGEWIHYNDAEVFPSTWEEVKTSQAYILFYRKED